MVSENLRIVFLQNNFIICKRALQKYSMFVCKLEPMFLEFRENGEFSNKMTDSYQYWYFGIQYTPKDKERYIATSFAKKTGKWTRKKINQSISTCLLLEHRYGTEHVLHVVVCHAHRLQIGPPHLLHRLKVLVAVVHKALSIALHLQELQCRTTQFVTFFSKN